MNLKQRLKNLVLSSSIVAVSLMLAEGSARAQSSLPFDTDLTHEASQEQADSASNGSTGSLAQDTVETAPAVPPGPLMPVEPTNETAPTADQPAPPADQLPDLPDLSEPLPDQVPLKAPEDRSPEEDLPAFLVGQNVETAINFLERDGWKLIARSPNAVHLDRGDIGLDLSIDGVADTVVEAELIDL